MSRFTFLTVVLSSICTIEQAAAKGPIEPAAKDISDSQIEKLVAQLASPNQAPKVARPDVIYGPKYDHDAQAKVYEAWDKLKELAPRSFPFLFDHFGDKRYAITEDAGDFDENYSVGFLCRDILVSHLQPDVWGHKEFGTSFRGRPHQPDYIGHFDLLDPQSARKWWPTRKGRTLRELQLEVLEWVIKEEERLTDAYTKEDRAIINEELAELRASREPRKPGGRPFAK